MAQDRGRDAHCWAPTAQIRTGPIRASGSYLGCLTAKALHVLAYNLTRVMNIMGPGPS
jgi:hypothetical protein